MIEEEKCQWTPEPVFVSEGELCGVPFDMQITPTPGEGRVTIKMEAVLPPMRWPFLLWRLFHSARLSGWRPLSLSNRL